MSGVKVKQEVRALLDRLPANVTWEEVAYQIAARASVARGLVEADAGELESQDEVERRFGLGQ